MATDIVNDSIAVITNKYLDKEPATASDRPSDTSNKIFDIIDFANNLKV